MFVIPSVASIASEVEGQPKVNSAKRIRGTVALMVVAMFALTGCAGPIEHWIVNTRIHQGEIAANDGNPADAVIAYSLALRVDPHNVEAQSGFVEASADEAQEQYAHGHFDAALATIAQGMRVDPTSVRLDALKTQISEAKLKQEIVISNYPTYQHAGEELQASYERLNEANALIMKQLRRFGYTYDVNDLTSVIKQSYELQLEVAHLTARLIAYRQLVQTGGPQPAALPATGSGSLLPLP
jgi:tetratricopeptide (TPR) repeat protein